MKVVLYKTGIAYVLELENSKVFKLCLLDKKFDATVLNNFIKTNNIYKNEFILLLSVLIMMVKNTLIIYN